MNRNLKARLSWSTSFGRPSFNNALPNETPNEANQTLTINNPALLPQSARNWDASLEYYFEPVGAFSIGWFHKSIRDYIVSGIVSGTVDSGNDNGYNGEYAGFTILRASNAGTATVKGWEFSYQQQFTFLPGILKGLSGMANFTRLETEGDFGGGGIRRTGQVAGFVPRSGNASLSWRYRGFSTRLLFNYTGEYLTSYTAASVGRNIYRRERRMGTSASPTRWGPPSLSRSTRQYYERAAIAVSRDSRPDSTQLSRHHDQCGREWRSDRPAGHVIVTANSLRSSGSVETLKVES